MVPAVQAHTAHISGSYFLTGLQLGTSGHYGGSQLLLISFGGLVSFLFTGSGFVVLLVYWQWYGGSSIYGLNTWGALSEPVWSPLFMGWAATAVFLW